MTGDEVAGERGDPAGEDGTDGSDGPSLGAVRPPPPASPHLTLNPVWLPPAIGFSHVVVPAPGLLVFLGGQAGHRPDGTLAGPSLLEQFDQACTNVIEALAAAGGWPQHIVSTQIFVTDIEGYRASQEEIGEVYRKHFGRYFPAMALFAVSGLMDPGAKVELVCIGIIPRDRDESEHGGDWLQPAPD